MIVIPGRAEVICPICSIYRGIDRSIQLALIFMTETEILAC